MKIFIFSKKIRSKQKFIFSEIFKIHQISDFRVFGFCEFLRFFEKKNSFVFWSIFFEKTKFSKTHFIFHFVCIMSLRCQISKSADRFENSLRCLQQKKRTFIPEISTRHPFQTLVKAMSSESKMTPPKWSFFKVRFVWRHRKPL